MKNQIVYRVIEYNASNSLISCLHTKSAMIALSDILLKSRINERPSVDSHQAHEIKRSCFYQGQSKIMLPQIISGNLTTFNEDNEKRSIISSVEIETLVSNTDILDGFTDSTLKVYRETAYIKSLVKFSNRLRTYSHGDIEIALVITALAVREKSNKFWHEKEVGGWKKRSLTMF